MTHYVNAYIGLYAYWYIPHNITPTDVLTSWKQDFLPYRCTVAHSVLLPFWIFW